MGKQCVVIAVLFAVRENSNAGSACRVGITTNQARLWINCLILYICETFPESNRAGLIGEWTRQISSFDTWHSTTVMRQRRKWVSEIALPGIACKTKGLPGLRWLVKASTTFSTAVF